MNRAGVMLADQASGAPDVEFGNHALPRLLRVGDHRLERCHIPGSMTLDLTDDEKLALVALLRRTIEGDPYPLSPRVRTLRAILAKLEPGARTKPYPAPKLTGEPSMALARRRQRR